jgi:DNA-binding protein YbaB
MASRRELRALITLAGRIDPSLSTALMRASGESSRLQQRLNQTNREFRNTTASGRSFGDMLKASFLGNLAANAVSRIASEVKSLGSEALGMASDLVEVQNVIGVTFKDSSKQIDAWSKTTLDSYGITDLQAKSWSGTMGSMLKSSGIASDDMLTMSTSLAGLAGDYSSFYNLEHEDAWNKIRAGISGETEPLKQLGINMSVANMEAYALSRGITKSYQDMDQAEQTLLRYNYLLANSTDAQGDYKRSLDESWENQKRLLTGSIMQKAAEALSKFIPLFTDATKKANKFVSNIDMDEVSIKMEQGFKLVGDSIGWVKDNLSWLMPIAAGAVSIMTGFSILGTVNGLMATWRASTIAQQFAQGGLNAVMSANPIGAMIIGIGILIAVGLALWKNWDEVSQLIVGIWQDYLIPFFEGIGAWFSGIWTGMVDGFKLAWSGIASWFGSLWEGVIGVFKGYLNIYVGIFNFLIGGLNKIKFDVPDWVPGIGGKTVGVVIPTLQTFAMGGIATQASIFGEAGAEMAIPLKKTPRSISLLQQTAQILGVHKEKETTPVKQLPKSTDLLQKASQTLKIAGKSAGDIINITININGGDLKEVKRVVDEAIKGHYEDEEMVAFG